ncbi:hypothetical protein GCM10007242_47630 [Pigmentiphaga litoralis]|jgi:alkylhydroperoxidase/carboxymuconolactone decarboxylase family protein YurZ|uniref:carboxymuconolactone decarboxylase family protein n=1 Tax=Pigmentiphaga litoralis TaxID=516702 RepID=UPI0016732496|nr:carboxymuconolactone decarboxylase family protein [Pigmentiphaga litoralis]GGX35108.1 hypothetical protein GCM10007242_47630 [Pigmentiphaga litoralis]
MAAARLDPTPIIDAVGPYADTVATLEDRAAGYRDMIGFLPPRVEARLHLTGALDPTILDMQEKVRAHAIENSAFDPKQTQLMLFGMLVVELSDAAFMHGVAARKAGATWAELQSVVNLAYVFRGVSAANRGAEFIAKIIDRERAAAGASASTPTPN